MRVTLSESYRMRKRKGGMAVVSLLIHTVILGGVLAGTGYSKTAPSAVEVVDTVIYTQPKPTPARPVTTEHGGVWSGEVPPGLPPIPEIIEPVELPIDVGSIGTGPEPPDGEFVHASLGAGGSQVALLGVHGGAPFEAGMVEKAVVPRPGNPTPRYPQFLASAGVEGSVIARFVVDTLGYVEPQSIQIVHATQAHFERAVRDAIPRMRFFPAEFHGGRVRQLVEQAFGFRLTH